MGHAHHFLTRLDRVAIPQVEFALSLYRDENLLRFIISKARIPEAAEKVALSLDHPENGPFLIVTRSGRFVTCLGPGMKPRDDQPIITKGQLDALAAKAEDLRDRMAQAQALAKGKGVQTLLHRIYDAGDDLSREEFIAISALHPLYTYEFLALHYDSLNYLLSARDVFIPILKKTPKPKPKYHEALYDYWKTFWAMPNFLVLAAMSDNIAETYLDLSTKLEQKISPTWGTTRQGWTPIALRGAWVAGRLGKPWLGKYKRYYQEAPSYLQTIDAGLGLLSLGFRHARLKAEVEKALMAPVAPMLRGTPLEGYHTAIRKLIQKVGSSNADAIRYHHLMQQGMGALRWTKLTEDLPPGPYRFKHHDDVPEDLALTFAVTDPIPFAEEQLKQGSELLIYLLQAVPWVAKASAEQLYLPKGAIQYVSEPWRPDKTVFLLQTFMEKRVARRPAGPSRQGPCPCGSGKKYKRCCEEKDKAKAGESDASVMDGEDDDVSEGEE